MNDRELLEQAAKAAGYTVVWNDHWKAHQHVNPLPDLRGDYRHAWLPLDDDGDALRLANRCNIEITRGKDPLGEPGVLASFWGGRQRYFVENAGEDVDAATRRAIVRAAAEMSKQNA